MPGHRFTTVQEAFCFSFSHVEEVEEPVGGLKLEEAARVDSALSQRQEHAHRRPTHQQHLGVEPASTKTKTKQPTSIEKKNPNNNSNTTTDTNTNNNNSNKK